MWWETRGEEVHGNCGGKRLVKQEKKFGCLEKAMNPDRYRYLHQPLEFQLRISAPTFSCFLFDQHRHNHDIHRPHRDHP